MANLTWLFERLKAMSIPEVAWRVSQKVLQKKEQSRFSTKTAVTSYIFNKKYKDLQIDVSRMHLNLRNADYSLNNSVPLIGGYNYEIYKKRWHAGFQTKNEWPLEFSHSLEYKQRDDVGDARTNWELNRHFQLAVLAKDYTASGDKQYLDEFIELFRDWNDQNPYLWGISWTSVMEIAIRCSNWCYAYCFLSSTDAPNNLREELKTGIINMTDYITQHFSRYSSANNHLIVEAYAIGQTGILCDYEPWIDLAVKILTQEFPRQNYPDGINKELSLHYQSFYIESMGLLMRMMANNDVEIPDSWYPMLSKMCEYLRTCIGDYDEVVEFGDNDEGKILDLQGGLNHYQYVLELLSCVLPVNYTRDDWSLSENMRWLYDEKEIKSVERKEQFVPKQNSCYRIGGNTILRSEDRRILIGIDHAALGFSSIAAHGHADALSFQMFVDGKPIFVDPGTYIYHCDLESRNEFRKTCNHNTVCLDDKDQSEMLGAFLWGKRAETKLIDFQQENRKVRLAAEHDGYKPIIHRRTFDFDNKDSLIIEDTLNNNGEKELSYVLPPNALVNVKEDSAVIIVGNVIVEMVFDVDKPISMDTQKTFVSTEYGKKEMSTKLVIKTKSERIRTNIHIRKEDVA